MVVISMPDESTPHTEETPPVQMGTSEITCDCGWGCDSEDDTALLEMSQLDCEAELHLSGYGQGPPPVYMSSRMLSYLVEYPLADKLRKLSLKRQVVYPRVSLGQSKIVWGDRAAFSNPWVETTGTGRGY